MCERVIATATARPNSFNYHSHAGFVFELAFCDEAFWPTPGRNLIEVTCLQRDGQISAAKPLGLRDVELEIGYRRGRHWHRGEETGALGPSLLRDGSQSRL